MGGGDSPSGIGPCSCGGSKSEVCRAGQQTGHPQKRLMLQPWSICLETEFPLLRGSSVFFLLRASVGWMRPTTVWKATYVILGSLISVLVSSQKYPRGTISTEAYQVSGH